MIKYLLFFIFKTQLNIKIKIYEEFHLNELKLDFSWGDIIPDHDLSSGGIPRGSGLLEVERK